MPRKGSAPRRDLMPDPVHRSVVVTQLVNKLLQRGKRSLSEKIVYDALSEIERKTGTEPVATVKRAVENVRPVLEVKSRRVGGATYQVPVEARPRRHTVAGAHPPTSGRLAALGVRTPAPVTTGARPGGSVASPRL